MAKVLGLGGVFFKSADPARLRAWYARWLGLYTDGPGVEFYPDAMPPNSYAVWSPFPANSDYFSPATRDFMVNFVVDDLDGALEQAEAGGAQVMDEIEEADYGRFGWFIDPDGNKVELWEPPAA